VSYFAVLIGLLRITHRGHPRPTTARPSVFTGLRFIQSRPVLAALSWQMVFVSMFAVSFIPILPVFAREVLKTDATGYGAMTSAIGVGAAIGAIVTGGLGRRVRRTRMATVCALGLGLAVMVLAVTRSTFGSWLVLAIGGAAMAGTGIATATSLQLAATPELRGRVMAVYSFVVLGLAPIGAFQAGWVAEHFGTPVAIAVCGAICVAGTLGLRRRLWNGKEE
jgi:MFS family permease